jgi:hypothetical protein
MGPGCTYETNSRMRVGMQANSGPNREWVYEPYQEFRKDNTTIIVIAGNS